MAGTFVGKARMNMRIRPRPVEELATYPGVLKLEFTP